MQKTEYLSIYATYSNLEVVRQTLPTVIEETKGYANAKLIVHDSTELEHGQEEKWEYLKELSTSNDFFLILSSNMSMAHARNMCLQLGQELYAPDYIAMMEDDHGYNPGLIDSLVSSMKNNYGQKAPNGLKYGLFSGCLKHCHYPMTLVNDNDLSINISNDTPPGAVGGLNSCFRCAPTQHWNNILKGYDTDEYLISTFQTSRLCYRNYHKGFTNMVVQNGSLMFDVDAVGRGTSADTGLKLWDNVYTKSDDRSQYLGKEGAKESKFNSLKRKIKKLKKF